MKRPGGLILGIIAVILVLGASAFFYQPWRAGKSAATSPSATEKKTQVGETGAKPAPGEASPYILPILGKSEKLTKAQTASMDKWRKSILDMARQQPGEIHLNGKRDKPAVGLTFDDGPDGVITPQVLKVLRSQGVQATFFFTGKQMQSYPQVVQDVVSQGHLALSHTYSHLQLDHLKAEGVEQEVEKTDQLFLKLTGRKPSGVRPPYGAVNADVAAQLKKQGKVIIIWSIDTLDWSGLKAPEVAGNVLDNVRPGDIILMHSIGGRSNTVQALPLIIQGLRQKGYDMVRLDELMGLNL